MPLMWTPKGADPTVGTIVLEKATELTREQYLGRVQARVGRLIAEATPGDRKPLELMAMEEGLDLAGLDPMSAADVLMMSDQMSMMAQTWETRWPVPASQIRAEATRGVDETGLVELTAALYPQE